MASSSSTSLSLLLLIFSLLSVSSAQTLTRAAAILSNSGYTSMSLALDFASHSLNPQPPSLTVFAPSDAAFASAGDPTLDDLRFHLLPAAFPLRSLKSLPFGAKVSTLLDGHPLAVTNLPADRLLSLNNVTVAASPIYDGGDLIIFAVDGFFSRYFQLSAPIGLPNLPAGCSNPNPSGEVETASFDEASKVLRSKGCSVMAAFLEMQFHEVVQYQTMLTVFAPVDQAMASRVGDLSQYASVLRRHVVPCRLSWSDLTRLDDGSILRTDLDGFVINVSRGYDAVLELNGVPVIMPEIYQNSWLVVHGVSEILELPTQSPIVSNPAEPNPVVPTPPQTQTQTQSQAAGSGEVLFLRDLFIVLLVGLVVYCFFKV